MPETITKRTWTKVAFGDFVQLSKERSKNPEADGLEHYVGLEHLKPGELKVRSWGDIADGTTFTNVFHPGQVLFGKRRAYQRKVAVADFSGVCSGDIYVLAPKGKNLLLELLPFICQTDAFFDHAVGTSAGSLSPRTNWKSLATFEFALPPLDQQQRIVEVLQAAHAAIESHRKAAAIAITTFRVMLEHLFANGLPAEDSQEIDGINYPGSWPILPLSDLASVERGKFSHRPRNLPEFFGGPYPFVQTGDVAASVGFLRSASQSLSEEGVQYSRSFAPSTVLITIAAVIGETAITTTETWAPDSVVGVVPSDCIDVRFLEFALRRLQPKLDGELATKSTQKNINLGILRPLPIPCPSREDQQEIVERLSVVEDASQQIEARIASLRRVQSSLLDKVLPTEATP